MMAKDATSGPVSKPEGGYYKTSEEVREEDESTEEILTRPEVINLFGEKIGQNLIDAGYSTVSQVINATDEELGDISGIGEVSVAKIRSLAPSEAQLEKEAEAESASAPSPSGLEQRAKDNEVSVRIQRIRDSQS
jgi:ERCC4-type nuclease